jgi:prevent-host-death family protein
MSTYTLHAAKTHLSRLIEQACAGEEVIITRGNEPLVQLVPIISVSRQRVFGSGPGGCHRCLLRAFAA